MNIYFKRYLRTIYDRIYNWDVLYDLFKLDFWRLFRKSKKGQKLFYNYLKLRFLATGKVVIPFLSVFVTTNCSLNCKECCAFVNRYKKENHLAPIKFEKFKQDLDLMLKAVDNVMIFQIVGGEPLLCKDLPQMIRYAASRKQIKHIFITTNCTIMPSEELLKTLKETKTSVEISLYKNATGVNQHYYEIKNILEKNNIRYSGWIEKVDSGFSKMQNIYEDNNNEKLYLNCFASKCNTLCDGKFYLCPATVYMDRNILNNSFQDEIIDISNKNLPQKLINFYSKETHNLCSYCHFDFSSKPCIAGEQERIP